MYIFVVVVVVVAVAVFVEEHESLVPHFSRRE